MQGKPNKQNLIGKKFGKLKVINVVGRRGSRWLCRCDCGKDRVAYTSDFKNNHTISCGCMDGKGMLQHGLWKTRFYRIYDGLKRRCRDKENENYHRYGGRGIKCLWETALDFKNEMYVSYLKHVRDFGEYETTIERINNNGNYCKNNCKWATRSEQSRNRKDNVFIKYRGKKMTAIEYAQLRKINPHTLYGRIRRGWDNNKIINEKIHTEFSRQQG